MKKLVLLLLLLSATTHAQIINIPDANFKAKLLEASPENGIAFGNGGFIKIDANEDLEIDLAEAQAIDSLDISSSNIADATGIAAFVNLKGLNCQGNQIPSLDVSMMPNLRVLYCYENALTSLEVPNLKYLFCYSNQLSSLDLAGRTNLEVLGCADNQLTSIDLSGLSALQSLGCSNNLLTALDLTGLDNLQGVDCGTNLLSDWQVGNLPSLAFLRVSGNAALNSLSMVNLPALKYLACDDCHLGALDFSGIQDLETLSCTNNPLTTLDFTGMEQLRNLYCNATNVSSLVFAQPNSMKLIDLTGSPITALDVSQLPYLYSLGLASTPIGLIDITNNFYLSDLGIGDNPDLHTMLLKNGMRQYFSELQFSEFPSLTYICGDDIEIADLATFTGGAIEVNSYCTAEPSPVLNSVSGYVYFDAAGDGCQNDQPIPYWGISMAVNYGTMNGGASMQNCTGMYFFSVANGTYNVTPTLENPALFSVNPPVATINFPLTNGSVATQSFCISAVGVHPDVEVFLVQWNTPRPGFDTEYVLMYRNKGNQTVSGTASLGFQDEVLDVVSTSQTPSSIGNGLYTYDFVNLQPFETREIHVVFSVNGPMDTPPVNLNDFLDFTATVSINGMTDEDLSDNTVTLHDLVTGSFDPNNKICMEGNVVSPEKIGEYLHYTINFENTGTAAAENVFVRDMIDAAKYEVGSLQITGSSHPEVASSRREGNRVEFLFYGIGLEPEAKGYVTFKIKTKESLQANDSVSNKADIFFDYNFPVITEPAVTTFQILATQAFDKPLGVNIFPNPAGDTVYLTAQSDIRSVEIYDGQGRLLQTNLAGERKSEVSLRQYTSGIYYFKISTAEGTQTQKIIKQ
ncbi:leucine-rich repeat domain-containing protein [Flavobacterium sp.]|uniref:DUF7619 domain-containing protein n=1 Tax=Flavobacterium sp. TaxID=239 RepID=UPI0039E25EF6